VRVASRVGTPTRQAIGLAWLAVVTACRPAPDTLATLAQLAGDVSLRRGEAIAAGKNGARLIDGDLVTTGADSSAVVDFSGGNTIRLGPNSSLVVKRTGGATAKLGVVLTAGSAHAASSGTGMRFSLGTPYGMIELGQSASAVDVSTQQGLTVRLGSIEVTALDGTKSVLETGNSMTAAGLVVRLETKKADAPRVLAPLNFVLLANPGQVQVRRANETAWKKADKRDILAAGDALRTRKAGRTRLQVGTTAAIVIEPESELALQSGEHAADSSHSRYELNAGSASFEADRIDKAAVVHEVTVAGKTVKIEAGDLAARVQVSAIGKGRADVEVRSGQATLPNGEIIEAGKAATLEADGKASAPRPLAAAFIELKAGNATELRASGTPPPVRFTWPAKGAAPYTLEVALDAGFNKRVLAEEVHENALVSDELRYGKYFWRVRLEGAWVAGSVDVAHARDNECPTCKRRNIIDDSGENTVVYFQKTLPAITLRFAAVPGASSYGVKVFADGSFDTPKIDEKTNETSLALESGRLSEGRYFWLVRAVDAAGKELSSGHMNGLTVAYDNAVQDIEIRAPRPGAKVSGETLTTEGVVALASKLFVNGKQVQLDAKGRFRQTVPVSHGLMQLVYRTIEQNGVERYYVRDVYAK